MSLPRIVASFLLVALTAGGPEFGAGTPDGGGAVEEDPSHRHAGVPGRFPEHPAVGDLAPDFSLRDLAGRWTGLGEFLGRGYVVLFFGSASSTLFRKGAPEMDRLARDWERLEVKVILVYTREAHPATLLKRAPKNYRERAALARQAREELKLGVPVLVDEWDDAVHKAYGEMPDAAFLLDSRGTILFRQAQAGPASLEKELMRLLKMQEPPGEPAQASTKP
jgi:AhpC/TSA family protein